MAIKALVVDDSFFIRQVVRKELETAGFEVFEADDGKKALEMAAEIEPHVITMDVNLPGMNGYETVKKLRTELRLRSPNSSFEVPVIFITSNDTEGGRKAGFHAGATDFIVKPFLKGELARLAKNLLNPEKTLQSMTVLVADDSALSRNIIQDAFEQEGINQIIAKNGKEALDLYRKNEDRVDLILTDLNMPEMGGDELCRYIRHKMGNKSIPILLLALTTDTEEILNLYKSGASDYITKPFVKETLIARIRVHLETRQLNKELFKQVHEYKRLIKLQDDVLSVTSHDLRSPLNGILGFTNLMLEEGGHSEEHSEYLKNIRVSGEFLLTLVGDILDLGRAQSENNELEMNVVSLDTVIDESIRTASHMATPKKIVILLENQFEETPPILGDKNAMMRIFNNLLSNAIKFSNENRAVKIIVEPISGSSLKVSVVDNGIGIPEDKIGGLFERFTKASRVGTSGEKSTGLGMAITKELVERQMGAISVSSVEGEGSTFSVVFPIVGIEEQDITLETTIPAGDEQITKRKVKVLVVDDNALNIKLAAKMMQKRGYQVESASDGAQGFQAYVESLNSSEKLYDAIFMDIRMPVMDGFEATEKIRMYEYANQITEIPIIAMTAGADDVWRDRCLKMGLNATITKPIDMKQIAEAEARFLPAEK